MAEVRLFEDAEVLHVSADAGLDGGQMRALQRKLGGIPAASLRRETTSTESCAMAISEGKRLKPVDAWYWR